ncbi:hypothetical protein QTP88_006448 [Uroleucon formosanum]
MSLTARPPVPPPHSGFSIIESYSEALKKCKKAVFTSNLSSSKNNAQVSKQKLNTIKNTNRGKTGADDTDDSDNLNYEMPNYESDANDYVIVCRSPNKRSQKFRKSEHLSSTVLTPKKTSVDIKSPIKGSSSQKFFSQHVPDTILSPKQVEQSSKKASSQKFSCQYNTNSDTMSPKLQNYENMSAKKTLSQKSTIDVIFPLKKTPTKIISFSDYSPNLLLSSKKHYSSKNSKNNLCQMSGHFIKKQLFKQKKAAAHIQLLVNDQFKDMVSHNLIIMKHSIRILNEKLDFMMKEVLNYDIDGNYTNLNCIFPINYANNLNDIEEQLTNKLVGLGGKTIQIYVKRVMQLLFTDELLKYYSFNGRANKKKCFCNLVISKPIFSSIKMIKKFNYEGATDDAEKYIKTALIQAPFNI